MAGPHDVDSLSRSELLPSAARSHMLQSDSQLPPSSTVSQPPPPPPPQPAPPPSTHCDADDLKPGNRPGKRPSGRGTIFYPRKRSNAACQVCRARKTKCDNKLPSCSYCVSVGANCIQSPIDLSSFDPASLKVLGRLNDLEQTLQGLAGSLKTVLESQKQSVWCSSSSSRVGDQGFSTTAPDASVAILFPDPETLCLWSHGYDYGFQPARYPSAGTVSDSLRICRVLPQRVDHIVSWSIFRGDGQASETQDGFAPSQASPLPSTSRSNSLFDLLESDSGRMNQLLDVFFSHIHNSNPILDETQARRSAREALLRGIDWSPDACLCLIMCALGCLAAPLGLDGKVSASGTPAYADSLALFEACQKRIGSLVMKNDLVAAQCLFLSGVYMMHLFKPVQGWRYFLQASAICQSLPSIAKAREMGSSPAASPSMLSLGSADCQEQAVYWSAWKSERELRGDLFLPDFESHDFGSTLYPPFFPTPPIPSDAAACQTEAEALRSRESWLFYLADISLRRLRTRVCSAMLSLERSKATSTEFLAALLEVIPDYKTQVRQWRDGLPEELSLASTSDEDTINRYILRGMMMNYFEIIYWPFIIDYLSRLMGGLPVPSGFSEMASQGLDTQMTQIRINERGFEHRHHGCYFMIKSCTRSAMILLAAAKAGAKMPDGWQTSVFKVAKMQAYWESEFMELSSWRRLIEHELALAAERTEGEQYM